MTEVHIKDISEVTVTKHHDSIYINDIEYSLITNYKEAFDKDSFEKRYTKLLDKYPYIVGDWGHEQLRLKGFYSAKKDIPFEKTIAYLQEYLIEYCSFGCRYFVLKIVHEELIQKNLSENLKKDMDTKTISKVNFKTKPTNAAQVKLVDDHHKNDFKMKSKKNTSNFNEKEQFNKKKNNNNRKHPFTINKSKNI